MGILHLSYLWIDSLWTDLEQCLQWCINFVVVGTGVVRADSRFAPSQWETALLCNDVSHWLGAILESALGGVCCMWLFFVENHVKHSQSAKCCVLKASSFYLSIHSSDRSVDMICVLSIHSSILLYTWFALTDRFPCQFQFQTCP